MMSLKSFLSSFGGGGFSTIESSPATCYYGYEASFKAMADALTTSILLMGTAAAELLPIGLGALSFSLALLFGESSRVKDPSLISGNRCF